MPEIVQILDELPPTSLSPHLPSLLRKHQYWDVCHLLGQPKQHLSIARSIDQFLVNSFPTKQQYICLDTPLHCCLAQCSHLRTLFGYAATRGREGKNEKTEGHIGGGASRAFVAGIPLR